jgi:phosphoglycerol transferase MdoB-like AlkP superfamily enzyme
MRKLGLPTHIQYLVRIYLAGIVCFALLRLVLLFTQWENVTRVPFGLYYFGCAFVMGWRFDTSICGYLLLLPLVCLTLWRVRQKKDKWIAYVAYYFINTVFILCFFISTIDIPYFNVFSTRVNIAILNWTSSLGFGLGMVAKEPVNWAYTFVFLSISYAFYRQSRKCFSELLMPEKQHLTHKIRTVVLLSLFFIGLTILAIRGRVTEKSPIRIGTAYFSQYTFPNQLGLNAVFTFFKSYLESQKSDNEYLNLMDEERAKGFVAYTFGTSPSEPATRKMEFKNPPSKANVVLVIMESMTAVKMGRFGNPNNLTPFLDSIANAGTSFDNTRSAGIHTYNGIYSTLFSQPALLRQHPMNKSVMHQHTGLSKILRETKYQTIYFTTHDDQFDNVGGFLTHSYFQRIVSQHDYPSELVQSTLGVPDHQMFRFAVPLLDTLASNKKPFFATFMTASDHMPYILPDINGEDFGNDDMQNRIVRYADWSLRDFVTLCRSKSWFENTIFVFVADHGLRFGADDYDPPISLNHIPFIVYGKNLDSHQKIETPANQIDVFPTLMGLMNIRYTNNTLGMDLLNEKRQFSYFCADDKIGCISDSLLYIYRLNGPESLHFYKTKQLENVIKKYPKEASTLKEYAFAMLQTSQWMTKEGLTK